jgi:hypothetical protein
MSKHHTVADTDRFDALRALGCIVSRIFFGRWEPADIHHLVEGRKRLGHQYTIPLSPWFHRGVPPRWDMRPSEVEAHKDFGPSLARSKRSFVARFGTERELLAHTNTLLKIQEQLRTVPLYPQELAEEIHRRICATPDDDLLADPHAALVRIAEQVEGERHG